MAKNVKRIGVGCVRVSTDRQERSIDEQKESIREAASRDGVELLEGEAWCGDEGISGSILDRPGLQKLLLLCRTRPDVTDVYFWKRNRLARSIDPLDGLSIEREIERSGKRIHFIQGIQKTGNRLIDFLASGIEYAEAGQYLVNLSSDTIRGLVPLTRAGFDAGRPTPYGFDRAIVDGASRELYRIRNLGGGIYHKVFPSGEVQVYQDGVRPMKEETAHSTLVPGDPERVAVLRYIFEAYVNEEMGTRAIADALNKRGVPSARGGLWSLGTIRSILVNPVYYGANVWNIRSFSKYHAIKNGAATPIEHDGSCKRFNDEKNWIVADKEHGFEGLIPKNLWDAAQGKRAGRNKPFTRGKAVVAPYYLSGLATCTCGNHLQGQTKTSGKKKGYRKYHYYTCGGYWMKGETVCRRFHLPKELLEGPVLNALVRRLRAMGRVDNIRAQVKALLAEYDSPENNAASICQRITRIEEKSNNWEAAIEKGLDMDTAVEKLKGLAQEKAALEQELAAVTVRESMSLNVQDISTEIMASLDRMQEVLEKGSVAEVKAILRAYIGRVEYDPETNRARVGFLRMPARALVSELAPESARISMVAGARVGIYPRPEDERVFAFTWGRDGVR
jgi:DNA invertase Pin-like site-specific DNA recombinase